MTEEIEALYQRIANGLAAHAKVEFLDLWLYVGATDGCLNDRIFCKVSDGTFFKLDNTSNIDLMLSFSETILDLWEASKNSGGKWDEMTFHLASDGRFEIDFEYNAPEGYLFDPERDNQWIRKNLGDVEINESPSQES
ncbi:immunity protein YezG family protein [Luteolibacter luteus]|uniref:DUF600 family protein n=1 Tax=Luteolibacter luteus TaxID=2728835 RepID=A0A858RT09_9BACT|nr:immunity protein YezG family protein [Luteolibacter luteus]QJE99143.1 DUF600 family protein [Luteolibacter luteus]